MNPAPPVTSTREAASELIAATLPAADIRARVQRLGAAKGFAGLVSSSGRGGDAGADPPELPVDRFTLRGCAGGPERCGEPPAALEQQRLLKPRRGGIGLRRGGGAGVLEGIA